MTNSTTEDNKYPSQNGRRASLIIMLVVIGLCYFAWHGHIVNGQLAQLQADYQSKTAELQKLNAINEQLKQEVAQKSAALVTLQSSNDKKVKEAMTDAYKKAANRSDIDKLNAYNALIDRAGRSYNERRDGSGANQ